MSYDLTATFNKLIVKVDDIHPIDMYCINVEKDSWNPIYYANINQDIIGYGVNSDGTMQATNVTYNGLPIKRDSIQTDVQGEIPSLNVTVPNTDRVIEALLHSYDYLRGCEVYVMLYYADSLPTGATADYIGTSPDYRSNIKEKFFIDSCTSNKDVVTFNLKSKFNIQNVVVPRRSYSRECFWALADKYRGTECLGTGSISVVDFPTCDGSLDQCRERSNEARFGGFPSTPIRGLTII